MNTNAIFGLFLVGAPYIMLLKASSWLPSRTIEKHRLYSKERLAPSVYARSHGEYFAATSFVAAILRSKE